MSQIYFGCMPPGGSGEIFIEMYMGRNSSQSFTKPCALILKEFNGIQLPIHAYSEPYVVESKKKFGHFRSIDWAKSPDALEHIVNKYTKSDGIWFATYNLDIFNRVKQHWQDQVCTVSINYDSTDYDLVVQKWAEYQAAIILTQPKYQSLNIVAKDAVDFCKSNRQIFGYEIPKQLYVPADIEINFKDIYNEQVLKQIISKLGGHCSDQDWEFYRKFIGI
jgi:hypothetical protein